MTSFEFWIEIVKLAVLLISGAAIPIVIFLVGNRFSKIRQTEEKLRSDRIEIYNKILEPFMLFFSTKEIIQKSKRHKKDQEKTGMELASEKLLTLEYQDYCFKLSLVGSDLVVIAFNNLMQTFYNPVEESDIQGERIIKLVAILLLEIRKSLGNDNTKIHALEMLEWKISDIKKYKVNGEYPTLKQFYK